MNALQIAAAICAAAALFMLVFGLFRWRVGAAGRDSHPGVPVDESEPMLASAARNTVQALLDGRALWPEVFQKLNPARDGEVSEQLGILQRSQADVRTALKILDDELRAVVRFGSTATLLDALGRIQYDMNVDYETRIAD